MKDYLESLEIGEAKVKLSKDEIKLILAENGKVVTNETEKIKKELNDEIATYKGTISNLETKIKSAPASEDMAKLQEEITAMKETEAKRIADDKERSEDEILTNNIISSFGDKKFTSDYVKNGLITDIKTELKKSENAGKGINDIFETLVKDKEGIFENPNKPAGMPGFGDGGNNQDTGVDGFVSIIQEAQRK